MFDILVSVMALSFGILNLFLLKLQKNRANTLDFKIDSLGNKVSTLEGDILLSTKNPKLARNRILNREKAKDA